MSNFFNSELVQKELKEINELSETLYESLFSFTMGPREEKIEHIGILWLKSSKRGENKNGKSLQGKGWELYVPERSIEQNFKLFQHIQELYVLDNPTPKPTKEQLPTEIQIISNI